MEKRSSLFAFSVAARKKSFTRQLSKCQKIWNNVKLFPLARLGFIKKHYFYIKKKKSKEVMITIFFFQKSFFRILFHQKQKIFLL